MSEIITQAQAAQTLLDRREMRRSLAPFIRKVFETVDPGAIYEHNWHIDLVAEFLESCFNRDIKRGIINIPPGYLKSISANVALPAWALGHNPAERIVSGSYSEGLSLKHSVDTRLVIQSDWYRKLFPDVILTDDQNTKQKFQTTARGQRYAVSVGGTVTGDGGNILIVDDPINPKNAMSDTERTNANNWFDQTFYTRLRDKKNGVIIVIMQRLHQDDLTGHLLKKGGWELLRIPAVAEEDEAWTIKNKIYVRKVGELLHPAREDHEEIESAKIELGSYSYSGQYQQRPAPLGGGMVELKWFNRYETMPARETVIRVIQSWDTAQKAQEVNDPWGGGTWFETEKGYYLVDVINQRMTYPDGKRTVINWFDKWQPDVLLIEDKSSGEALIQDLKEDKITKYPVIAIQPTSDKITRMSTGSPLIEAGNCWLPVRAQWLGDYEQEISIFPNSVEKGQVDQTSQLLNWVKKPEKAIPQVRSLS
jgi:predicted phage terminase large subunit-like protein